MEYDCNVLKPYLHKLIIAIILMSHNQAYLDLYVLGDDSLIS